LGAAVALPETGSLLARGRKRKGKGKGKGKRRPATVVVCHNGETFPVPPEAVRGVLLDGGQRGACAPQGGAGAPDCTSPGPDRNLTGCNFDNRDFIGINLSNSRMAGTSFRGANLCGADLRTATLTGADFQGFADPGRPTTLFRADLSGSGCNGIQFNARTRFCHTRLCDGTFRDDGCPDGIDPEDVCCADADCPANSFCRDGQCVPCASFCPNGCCTPAGECRVNNALACGTGGAVCGPACADNQACVNGACVSCAVACPGAGCSWCGRRVDGTTVCGGTPLTVSCNATCTSSATCSGNTPVCTTSTAHTFNNFVDHLGPNCGFAVGTSVCAGFTSC
jgi:uncharacterized protein YjbI with pentapeptide repeats